MPGRHTKPTQRKRTAPRRRASRAAYSVYVVELDAEALPARWRGARVVGCLYVGQTAKTPEQRFDQHMRGGRLANTKVYKYGKRLRPDLYRAWNPFESRQEAEAAEQALAMELEQRGFVVFWG